jgi:hypothetical protein
MGRRRPPLREQCLLPTSARGSAGDSAFLSTIPLEDSSGGTSFPCVARARNPSARELFATRFSARSCFDVDLAFRQFRQRLVPVTFLVESFLQQVGDLVLAQ